MRALLPLVFVAAACSAPVPQVDAGNPQVDSGTPDAGRDAGTDAGQVLVCLADGVDAGTSDAGWDGGLDFSCRGRAPLQGGQGELVIAGKTTKAGFTRAARPDVVIDLVRTDGTVLATTTSGDGGFYRLSFDAGCTPLAADLRATYPDPTDAGYYVTWSVPPSAWQRDRSALELILFDQSTAGLVAAFASVTIKDGGVLALHIADCEGNAVAGATVNTGGQGDIRYITASGLPSASLTATSSEGDVLIFNLLGTSIDVSASVDGGLIGQRVIPVHPNAVTGSTIVP